ncbi:MAG: hypothetical protein ABSD90_14190 [Methylocystis sp.]
MNLGAIRRQMTRIETRLPMLGAGRQFAIARNSGMKGLMDAIQKAVNASTEGRGCDEIEAKAATCLGPIGELRRAILNEQASRAELFASTSIEKLCEEPAITDENEEEAKCAIPTLPSPRALNE